MLLVQCYMPLVFTEYVVQWLLGSQYLPNFVNFWCSGWCSSCFRHRRSAVRIQPKAVLFNEKTKMKKRSRKWYYLSSIIMENCKRNSGFFKVTNYVNSAGVGSVFFKKWANPGLFFVYFRSFQTNNIFLQQIKKKCPSSIGH